MTESRYRHLINAGQRAIGLARSKRVYLHAMSFYLAERLTYFGLNFLAYTAMARNYGPPGMGVYSLASTLVGFAAPFLAAGAEGIVVRELVRQKDANNTVLGSAFIIISTTSLVAIICPLAYLFMAHGNEHPLIDIGVFLAIGFTPNGFLIIEHFLKAHLKARLIATTRIAVTLVSVSTKLFLIHQGYPIKAVAAVTAAEAISLVIVYLAVYRALGFSPLQWVFQRSEAWLLFRQAFPAMLASAVVLVFFRINHILVARFASYNELGNYSVAFQVVDLFGIFPIILLSSVYPRLVQLHAENLQHFRFVIRWLYYGLAVSGYLIFGAVLVGGATAMGLLFGNRFSDAPHVLVVLALANVFNFVANARAQEINIYNAPHYHVISAAIGLAVLIPTSFHLIPLWGAIGAAWSVTVSAFVSGILTSFLFPPMRRAGVAQIAALLLIPPFSRDFWSGLTRRKELPTA